MTIKNKYYTCITIFFHQLPYILLHVYVHVTQMAPSRSKIPENSTGKKSNQTCHQHQWRRRSINISNDISTPPPSALGVKHMVNIGGTYMISSMHQIQTKCPNVQKGQPLRPLLLQFFACNAETYR